MTFPFDGEQINISFNKRIGTMRGMHYREAKLVICTNGSLYDVCVDLQTGECFPQTMTPGCIRLIPQGYAHGFQTLEDATKIVYVMSELYDPELSKRVHYDSFGIEWPLPISCISNEDLHADRWMPNL